MEKVVSAAPFAEKSPRSARDWCRPRYSTTIETREASRRARPASLSPGRVPGRVSEVAALAHSEWRSDICRHGDVSQGYIAKLEPSNRTGKSKTVRKNNPSVAILKRLARVLGVPVTELLE